jgi:hypothetical protein
MAYQINRYDNSLLTTVQDGTIDQTTDLKLVGKNYAGYGEIESENYIFLLENFAGANAPPRALKGQLWYDTTTQKVKFYDGTRFRTSGGAEVATTAPTGTATGDLWWDSANDQLYVYNGTVYVLIGPQSTGTGVTQVQSLLVKDTFDVNRPVVATIINDETITITAATQFTQKTGDPSEIDGFDVIREGVTLKNTKSATSGVTSTNHRFWGTAANALRLGGVLASEYALANNADFTNIVTFSDLGVAIGDAAGGDLKLLIENGNEAVIENSGSPDTIIKVKTSASGTLTHSVSFTPAGIVPASDSLFNIGSSGVRFATMYADSFNGVATQSDTLSVSGIYRAAATTATANTIAARDASGNIAANLFQGIATQARYADLAEKYTTDSELEPGTVVEICDHPEHEVEKAQGLNIIAGVVSTNPALMMNSEAEGQYIALVGRVPVKVSGAVVKGQPVYASAGGVATIYKTAHLVGIALESNDDNGVKLVECMLKV